MNSTAPLNRRTGGFTLVEILIAIAIVAILATVALPFYQDYVRRGKLVDAFAQMSGGQVTAEQFYQDSSPHTYTGFTCPAATKYFNFTCDPATDTEYTITATGKDSMSGFVYTVDQANTRTTTSTGPWSKSSAACWILRKDGSCS